MNSGKCWMLGSLLIIVSFVAISLGQQDCHRLWEEITEMGGQHYDGTPYCYQFKNPTCRWIYHPDVRLHASRTNIQWLLR